LGVSENTIEVPSFNSIDDYVYWSEENHITIRLVDENGEVINPSNASSILEIPSGNILTGEILEIRVSTVQDANAANINNTNNHFIITNPPYPMNRLP